MGTLSSSNCSAHVLESQDNERRPNQTIYHPQREVEFKLHIAIDFGTDGCGLAFAYKDQKTNKDVVKIYNKWRATSSLTKKKTKTQLILNKNNEVFSFGNRAKHTYYDMTPEIRKDVRLFTQFKMALYTKRLKQRNNALDYNKTKDNDDGKVDTEEYLYDLNGVRVKSEIVFVAAFKQLQRKAEEFIPQNITKEKINHEEIQWIVTVPAIWSEKSKDQMKRWIIKAGLVNPEIKNQIKIVYEPDCASLSIQKQFEKDLYKHLSRKSQIFNLKQGIPVIDESDDNKDDEKDEIKENPDSSGGFHADELYMLIDAGGGTVDVACHKMRDDGCVEEVAYPTGDKWGSCYIDKMYIQLLQHIFGEDMMHYFKRESPAGFVELKDHFQTAKESFYKDNDQNPEPTTHSVFLPTDFIRCMEQECAEIGTTPSAKVEHYSKTTSLLTIQKLFRNANVMKSEANFVSEVYQLYVQKVYANSNMDDSDDKDDYVEYLVLDVKIWKSMFDTMIDPIVDHVKQLLQKSAMKDCKYMGLVGGFSTSLYFQERMKDEFGIFSDYPHPKTIIIPKKPMLSVVEGAAWMGLMSYYVRARMLPYTYGLNLATSQERALKHGMSPDYIKSHTAQDGRVEGHFKIIARINERVEIDEVRKCESHRRGKDSMLGLLRSVESNPIVYTEGEPIGKLIVPHSDANKANITEFHFYNAMIEVYSFPKSNCQAKKIAQIEYD